MSNQPTALVGHLSLASASVGAASLIVSDLRRSVDFYAGIVGLDILSEAGMAAQLGVAADGRVLLHLEQGAGVRPLEGKRLGLFHTAFLLPSRAALASFSEHLQQAHMRAGSRNHLVSEAFYLMDPDGLQVEIYADLDRSVWPWKEGELETAALPLDLEDLLSTPHTAWTGVPAGTIIGHIHLSVGDLKQADELYRVGLGMNLRTRTTPGALFLAAGDYHHHVGVNTWAGAVPPSGQNDPRLNWWSLIVEPADRSRLQEQMIQAGWSKQQDDTFQDAWGTRVKILQR